LVEWEREIIDIPPVIDELYDKRSEQLNLNIIIRRSTVPWAEFRLIAGSFNIILVKL